MTKVIAIPLLLASGIGLTVAVPGLMHQNGRDLAVGFYWLAAVAFACGGVGLGILVGLIALPRKQMRTVSVGGGEFLLLPRQLRREGIVNAIVVLIAVAVPAIVLAVRLEMTFSVGPNVAHLFTVCAGLVFLFLVVQVFRRTGSTRIHSDLRVTLSVAELHLDAPFHIRAAIVARRPIGVTEFRARILCFEHVLMHSGRFVQVVVRQQSEVVVKFAEATALASGQTLSGSESVTLDSGRYPASGQWAAAQYPFYHWEIRVQLTGEAAYEGVFPIRVNGRSKKSEKVASY